MAVSETDIELAHRLADAAGAAIRPRFRAELGLDAKEDLSPVTLAEGRSGRVWVLDPIDGTRSFVAGRAIFGTLIALVEDGWPVLGVIDQPVQRERWIGAVGRQTLFNGAPAKTRTCRALKGAELATTSPHFFGEHQAEHYLKLATAVGSPLYGGDCYNYALLASGHIDIVVEAGLKLYDFAALVPVVEGAGGSMCDWAGDPLHAGSSGDVIAAGDPARVEEILEALACGH
jgi:inositol-phosphate phosphatase/L-galactose 1-phosphate phosphatase/histidinol-phosphatase